MRYAPGVATRRVAALTGAMAFALCGCGSGSGPGGGTRGAAGAATEVQLSSGELPRQIELTTEDNTVRAVIPADPEVAWDQLPRVYRDIGLSPGDWTVHDPAGHRVAVADLRVGRLAGKRLSLLLNCGQSFGTPLEDAGDVQVSLSTWLLPHADGTEVLTRFHGQQGQRGPLCASRGRIEREIVVRLLERLAPSPSTDEGADPELDDVSFLHADRVRGVGPA